MKFEEMSLPQEIVQSLQRQHIASPTEVQEKAIPLVLQGTDVIVRSKTGSGKTLAFLIPTFTKLTRTTKGPEALVLTPTRELAVQIFKDARMLDKNIRAAVVYGGVGISPQIDSLRRGVDILIATPGRFLDLMERRAVDLSHVTFAVLDEADRMLDMGFIDDVRRIISTLPKQRQMMLFSATMPQEVVRISQDFMNKPQFLMLGEDEITVNTIAQRCIGVDRKEKFNTLMKILRDERVQKGIVFCNTKTWAETLGNLLFRRGVRAMSLHSGLSQSRRQRVIDDFKQGRFALLVATDVAARGLHIDAVTHVFNYDLPRNPKDYIHRIGRTGRAGNSGNAISFVTTVDEPLLRNIEREINQFIDVQTGTGAHGVRPAPTPPSAVVGDTAPSAVATNAPRSTVVNDDASDLWKGFD
ncbi:DEAD/DEAH box helicase [Candidatus Woesearchaeota archaeon]|nr:DEAD/DEAH box helicase [Candidatus Woesearchaeota archaeon]